MKVPHSCLVRVFLKMLLLLLLLTTARAEVCPILEKTNAQVERTAHSTGLHRLLETLVWVRSSLVPVQQCTLLLLDTLPSGAYVDPEELLRLQSQGELPPSLVSGSVDIEVGEWNAAPTTVLYYPKLVQHVSDNEDTTCLVNLTVPVHARYHRARGHDQHGPEAVLRIPHPAVLLLCPHWQLPASCLPHTVSLPCQGHQTDGPAVMPVNRGWEALPLQSESTESATQHRRDSLLRSSQLRTVSGEHQNFYGERRMTVSWSEGYVEAFARDEGLSGYFGDRSRCYWLPIHSFSTTEGVTLRVPVGNTDQLELVLLVTLAVTLVATILLLSPLLRQYRRQQQ